MTVKRKILGIVCKSYVVIMLILTSLIYSGFKYVKKRFGISIESLFNTLTGPLEGTDPSVIYKAVRFMLPYLLLAILLAVGFFLLERYAEKKCAPGTVFKIYFSSAVIATCMLILSLLYVQLKFDIIQFIRVRSEKSTIYEDYYVDPRFCKITTEHPDRNLIMIYLESMENTYASVDEGGLQDVNYMPNLTRLAYENVSFSNNDKLGGTMITAGSSWTMAGLLATSAGIPYSMPVGGNDMSLLDEFASGLYTLGDFLESEGYNNVFLCGSNSAFAGRDKYYRQHGNYEIYDYNTALSEGYATPEEYVWWGLEDYRLYQIAKDKLLQLAQRDEPFNLTMLTVDTHHTSGWICPMCGTDYETRLANVVVCADCLVNDFVKWCEEQFFYNNTTIVIVGDHLRMDKDLVESEDEYERTAYNCFINPVGNIDHDRTKNRLFMSEDIFPTTLAAMGYQISGDRLGLGTNLFSNRNTLLEEIGLTTVNEWLSMGSDYYVRNFAPETMLGSDRWNYNSENELMHIYFYGDVYNAEDIDYTGISENEEDFSWSSDSLVTFSIPISEDKVFFSLKVKGTINGEQHYELLCNGKTISTGIINNYGYIEGVANNPGGILNVEIRLPDATSDYNESPEDTRKLGLMVEDLIIYSERKH